MQEKNRWIFQFAKVPGDSSYATELAFAAKTATIPELTFEAKEMNRLNERFYIAGKPTWNECSASFYDYINGTNSPGHILYNWANSIYNPVTGQMFFKVQYSSAATLAQLDPMGAVTRLWNMFYVWPTKIGFGEGVDYTSDDVMEASVTFRYDYAIKGTDVNTSPS